MFSRDSTEPALGVCTAASLSQLIAPEVLREPLLWEHYVPCRKGLVTVKEKHEDPHGCCPRGWENLRLHLSDWETPLKKPQLLQIRKSPPRKLLYFLFLFFYCSIVVFKMLFRKMVPYGQYWSIGITSPQYYFASVLETKIWSVSNKPWVGQVWKQSFALSLCTWICMCSCAHGRAICTYMWSYT